jgi:hypothetical protein
VNCPPFLSPRRGSVLRVLSKKWLNRPPARHYFSLSTTAPIASALALAAQADSVAITEFSM